MAKVNFKAGTLAQWNTSNKDTSTLYFITDAKKIYKGNVDVTESIVVTNASTFSTPPVSGTHFEGKLYVDITSFTVGMVSGSAWIILSPGYITDGTNWTPANSGKIATISAIESKFAELLSQNLPDVSYSNGTLTLGSGENTKTTQLTGIVSQPTYSDLVLTLPVIGGDNVVVNLPKDNFVRSGHYEANAELPDGGTGPALVLVVDSDEEPGGETEIVIPAAELVQIMTANNTGKDITVTITENGVISASAKIDTATGNALVTGENGLKVQIIDPSVVTDHIVFSGGNGTLKDSQLTVLTSGQMGNSATTVPVANVIATAISSAVSAAQGTLQDAIDALETKVTSLESFQASLSGKYLTSSVADNFVGFLDTSGNIKDSGKKAGGATLAGTPNANTLATEAAVAAAISWQVLS